MTTEKKIRITLPKEIYEIIISDSLEYGIKMNTLLNYLFEHLKDINVKKDIKTAKTSSEIVQFNLNKKNRENYYDFLIEKKIQNESNFFRDLCYYYAKKVKNEREIFLFKGIEERVNLAIKEKRIVKITFKDLRETEIEPYFFSSSKLKIANYLFCYDLIEKKWKNYRLKYILKSYLLMNSFDTRDKEFIDSTKKNFDPFLSNGNIVKVKLTKDGEILFNQIKTNRPKIIEKKGDVYILEASFEKAKRYFSYFYDDVEIVGPLDLREWFKEKLSRAYSQYK